MPRCLDGRWTPRCSSLNAAPVVALARGGSGWKRRLDAVALRGGHGFQHTQPLLDRGADPFVRTKKERRRSMSRSTRITTTLPTCSVHEVGNNDTSSDDGDACHSRKSVRSCKPSIGATTHASKNSEQHDAQHLRGCGDGADRARMNCSTRIRRSSTYAPDGFHPLGLAAFFGNKATVEALLQAGRREPAVA